MLPLQPGDVIAVFDGTTRPPKTKRLVCVVAADGWFLRINSNPHFRPHHPLDAVQNPGCLDHDSFVELRGVLELDLGWLADAMHRREASILGRICAAAANDLAVAVEAAPTLNRSEKDTIAAALRGRP